MTYLPRVFTWRYPTTPLKHIRVLGSRGTPRGVSVVPKLPTPEPEFVHPESWIIPLPTAGKVMVIEYTAPDRIDRHLVNVP